MKPDDIEMIYKMTFGKSGANLERVGELIRCKDCKHMNSWTDTDGTINYSCEETHDEFGYEADVEPNHYCGYAERREP